MARMNLSPSVVVAAAADLADASGYEAVTVSALARQLGVQPASLYSHVRDRAAVLEGVHQLALADLADRIAASIAGRSSRDALVGLVEAHRGFAREHPGRWDALQRPAALNTVHSEPAARLVQLIWAVLRGYAVPADELVHATRLVGATLNGFIALERVGAFAHRSPEAEVSWLRAIDVLDQALRSWPRGETAAETVTAAQTVTAADPSTIAEHPAPTAPHQESTP